MVSAPQEKRIPIPAEYQTVTRTEKVSDGHMEWRRIMCETNVTFDVVKRIQLALRNAGHDPGPIDGVYGWQTQAAMKAYQKEKGLAEGAMTIKSLESLGVNLSGI
jgi:peptidoglycan hydrolase-like protein with peptidoglycan-binding domain